MALGTMQTIRRVSILRLNKRLIKANSTDQEILRSTREKLGVNIIYRPRTSFFNALIVKPTELKKNRWIEGYDIYSGCNADGVIIPTSAAIWLATADCPTIVARNRVNGKTIAAHAGRYSLVDRQRLLGKSPRQHESVVNAMVEELLTGDD